MVQESAYYDPGTKSELPSVFVNADLLEPICNYCLCNVIAFLYHEFRVE